MLPEELDKLLQHPGDRDLPGPGDSIVLETASPGAQAINPAQLLKFPQMDVGLSPGKVQKARELPGLHVSLSMGQLPQNHHV